MHTNNVGSAGKLPLLLLLIVVSLLAVSCRSVENFLSLYHAGEQDDGLHIGRLMAASRLDASRCPVVETTRFDRSDSLIVATESSNVPEGTEIFARLSYEGEPIEDSVLIIADQDYYDTCIYFAFEARGDADEFDVGAYTVQLIVNGVRGPSVAFEVE